MSVIVTIDVAAADFVLGRVLSSNPGLRVELQQVVPVDASFLPYFWVDDGSVGRIERSLADSDDVASFEVVDTADGEAFVRAEWRSDVDGLLDAMAETGATALEAVGEAGAWQFRLRFADHDALSSFYRACVERDLAVDVRSVHDPGLPTHEVLDVTETQRETLLAALEAGYFEVPRRTTLTELAADLGVSDTAVSQRIRRGVAALLVGALSEADADAARRG